MTPTGGSVGRQEPMTGNPARPVGRKPDLDGAISMLYPGCRYRANRASGTLCATQGRGAGRQANCRAKSGIGCPQGGIAGAIGPPQPAPG